MFEYNFRYINALLYALCAVNGKFILFILLFFSFVYIIPFFEQQWTYQHKKNCLNT